MDTRDKKHSIVNSVEPTTRAMRDNAVRDAVERGDWAKLSELSSQPGGFQSARSVAWYAPFRYFRLHACLPPFQRPFLLHVKIPPEKLDDVSNKEDPNTPASPSSQPHRDERQVSLDTNRAFVHYPVGGLVSLRTLY